MQDIWSLCSIKSNFYENESKIESSTSDGGNGTVKFSNIGKVDSSTKEMFTVELNKTDLRVPSSVHVAY